MIVVANTTPILSLASVGHLDVLRQMFGRITLAPAVYAEIKAKPAFGFSEVDADWVEVQAIEGRAYRDTLLSTLDPGEAETLVLARDLSADWVIIDEDLGYRMAVQSGLPAVRTLSLLLRAKQTGLLSEVRPLIDAMIAHGRWYSPRVRQRFLELAGEPP